MKIRLLPWMMAVALAGVSTAQQSNPSIPAEFDGKVIPELSGYKGVTIRRVEPDGLKIIHESGTAKIPIEKLTAEQQAKFGLSMQGAAQYRQQVADSAAASRAQEQAVAADSRQQGIVDKQEAKSAPAKFVTADQVKAVWIKRLQPPRRLDPNYSQIMASYRKFIAQIQAGRRDLDAQETAATYNKAKAIEIGNNELAATYEAELLRIFEAKSAAEDREEARRDAMDRSRFNSELMELNRQMRDIRNTINAW